MTGAKPIHAGFATNILRHQAQKKLRNIRFSEVYSQSFEKNK
jgi:hypothetical protein